MPSMRRALAALSVVATAGSVLGCVPSFGVANRVVVVAKGGGADRMGTPRDLQFHPLKRDELWVASASTDGRLSGNYIITKPGTAQQTTRLLRDRVAYHYMDNVAAFEFSSDGRALFTCQESLNPYMGKSAVNYFQGPTAFEVYPCKGGYGRAPKSKCVGEQNAPNCATTEDCQIFTVTPDGKKDCEGDNCFLIHSDMLHEAPSCVGIAYDANARTGPSRLQKSEGVPIDTWNRSRAEGNVVWYIDGLRQRLMRFDFDELHGTEVIDHRRANVRRYVDIHVKPREGVPGHMVVDPDRSHLYIADTGNKRILRVNTTSGQFHRGAMCTNEACYRHENTRWTCGLKRSSGRTKYDSEAQCQSSDECKATPKQCRRDVDNLCDSADGGWCRHGECAGADGFGCYTAFTEMGYLFEYELWGCSEYEVFASGDMVGSPSGLALTPEGRLLVSDYDSGKIRAFDKSGALVGEAVTGSAGVAALHLNCKTLASTDKDCDLWFTNILDQTVAYLSVESACGISAAALPQPPAKLGAPACAAGSECMTDRNKVCTSTDATNRLRPDFTAHMGNTNWLDRMVIYHSYGKDCTGLPNALQLFNNTLCREHECRADGLNTSTCVGTLHCRVGENPRPADTGVPWGDADAVECPDRLDCTSMNLDLLVMAGFFCHPCLPNPCLESGVCKQGAPRIGYTCTCREGFGGDTCAVSTRSDGCTALTAARGVYTPKSLCQDSTLVKVGQTCNLQCANDNMLFVSADTSSSASSSSGVTPQHSLLQRTCELDAKTLKPRWIGPAAVCACREGFFGADCSNKVKHKARVEKLVGRAGGVVKDDSSGSGVSLPTGALTRDVVVSVSVFTLEDLGAAFPKADAGFTAASNVLELLPHGIRFEADVTVSIRVEESSGKRTSDRLALFFFNDTSTKWHEVAGSQKFSDAMGRPVVAGKTRHFSRWVVLEKPPSSGSLSVEAWIGIGVGAAIALVLGAGAVVFGISRMHKAPDEKVGSATQGGGNQTVFEIRCDDAEKPVSPVVPAIDASVPHAVPYQ